MRDYAQQLVGIRRMSGETLADLLKMLGGVCAAV